MEGPAILKACHHVLHKMRPAICMTMFASQNGNSSSQLSTCRSARTLFHLPRHLANVDCRRHHHMQIHSTFIQPSSSLAGKITAVLLGGVTCRSCVVNARRTMAGHSKWANIRHIKAAKDGARARVITDITNRARAIIKETGNADPKSNLRLARLIAEAKSKDVPNANIDRILTQMSKMKDAAPMLYEAKGPSGSVMLIEALAAKPQQLKSELQSIVRKCGFSLFDSGSLAMLAFVEKGVVTVDVDASDGKSVDMDRYVDIAIEAGAEEVTLEDETGEQVLQFLCEPDEVYSVKKALEERELPVRSAEAVFLSTNDVAFPAQDVDKLSKVLDKLDDHPDVLKV